MKKMTFLFVVMFVLGFAQSALTAESEDGGSAQSRDCRTVEKTFPSSQDMPEKTKYAGDAFGAEIKQ